MTAQYYSSSNQWGIIKTAFIAASFILTMTGSARAELPSATAEHIQQALSSGQPTLIDVGARTCIPCRQMAPILEALANSYRGKASILFVDLREDEATARQLRVQMIPTQIFFNAHGKEVQRHIGAMDEAALVAAIKALGVE